MTTTLSNSCPRKGIWYYGPTGAGKSHRAYENYSRDTHFKPCYWRGRLHDWTGYRGQETVIFDGPTPTFSELREILSNPGAIVSMRLKPYACPLMAKTVIVTSLAHPKKVYCKKASEYEIDDLLQHFDVVELTHEM